VVTYLKPAVGSEQAGFFVQATATGPALYVSVGSVSPQVGDIVSFQVTGVSGGGGSVKEAYAISNFEVLGTGFDVSTLAQDLSSSSDVLGALDDYESELVTITGRIATQYSAEGTGFVSARLSTEALPADDDLRFKLPQALLASADAGPGCLVQIGPVPLWRFDSEAHFTNWGAGEVQNLGDCAQAELVINELNGNLPSGCELVELRVVSVGSTEGYTLADRNDSSHAVLPEMPLDLDDLVIVHINSLATCNASGSASETQSKSEQASSSHAQNFDTAWDVYATVPIGFGLEDIVWLTDTNGLIGDAVMLTNTTTCTGYNSSALTETTAATIATAGAWKTAGGSVPAGGFVDEDYCLNAVTDTDGGSDATTSIQRTTNVDDDSKTGWQGPLSSSFGQLNAGQNPL
jgi:hypothetical protein